VRVVGALLIRLLDAAELPIDGCMGGDACACMADWPCPLAPPASAPAENSIDATASAKVGKVLFMGYSLSETGKTPRHANRP